MKSRSALLLVALMTCANGAGPAPAPLPAPAPRPNLALRLVQAPVGDTLVADGAWTVPNDGRGPIDSVTAEIVDVARGTPWFRARLPPSARSVTHRQPVPFADAQYDLVLSICTYRGRGAPACVNARQDFVYALAAPPPVSGLTLSVRRAP